MQPMGQFSYQAPESRRYGPDANQHAQTAARHRDHCFISAMSLRSSATSPLRVEMASSWAPISRSSSVMLGSQPVALAYGSHEYNRTPRRHSRLSAPVWPDCVSQRIGLSVENRFWDWRWGVSTHGDIYNLAEVGFDNPEFHSCTPIGYRAIGEALRNVPIPMGDISLLDIGCGKGRPLVVAERLGCRRIRGID